MNLLEVGALLKRERERRGISIRDVMDATKISRRNLTAIEEGQVKHLPHPVYLKGYVRNIATMVGLDPDELAQIVDLQCDAEQSEYISQAAPVAKGAFSSTDGAQTDQAPKPVEPTPHAQQHQAAPEREARKPHASEPLVPNKMKSGSTLRSVVALVLLVAALIGLLVQFQRPSAPPEPVPAAQPAVNASKEATDQGSPASLMPLENASETLQSESSSPPMPTTVPGGEPPRVAAPAAAVAPSAPALPMASVSASSVEVSRMAPVAEVRTPGMQQLTITAKENEVCWIEVNDGHQIRSFTLRNGESRQVEFASRIRVRLGNAGGVNFRLNAKDHPFEGKRGSIETVEFGTR